MIKLSAAAAQDIEAILERSVADFGIPQTETYYDSLVRCLELIDENPELGNMADDIRAGYRRFPHECHVIFYTLEQSDVFFVRILHKRMDAVINLQD